MKIFHKVTILLSLLPLPLFSQNISLSPAPEQFIQDAQAMMEASKNEEVAAVGVNLTEVWNGSALSSTQKESIINISHKMLDKRLKARPHFEDFYGAIINALSLQNIASPEMDGFLQVTEKVIDHYDNKSLNIYLQSVRNFFQNRALYTSSYNQLKVDGGTFSFEYIESQPLPEIEIPEESPQEEQGEEQESADDGWFSDWDTPASEDDTWSSDWDVVEEETSPPEQLNPLLEGTVQPDILGAVIKLQQANLVFISKFDSTAIKNTSGSFLIKDKLFVGNGGTFDWHTVGLSSDSVFVEFSDYNFEVTNPYLAAEKVKMSFYGKIDLPVEGVFEFKSESTTSPDQARYPRFKSYYNDINVKNLGQKNLVYRGGFALAGRHIYSSAVLGGLATIEIKGDAGTKFKAISNKFEIGDTLLSADRAAIVIYHRRDSIYHPAVQFKYNIENALLTLVKDQGGFKNTSFFASYYNMDITADMVKWDLDTDSLDISILNAKNQIPALFESQEYYNDYRFNSLSGIYDFHPLVMVVGYARKLNSGEFYSLDMADNFRQNPKIIKGAMVFLMQNGFIDYNPDTDLVKLKRKGYHYVLSKNDRKDFDNMSIASISPSQPNATFSFDKQHLKVRGIEKFYISEALNVFIEPTNDEIILLNNRDFLFDGKVNAGNFEYIGKDFQFKYDSFLLNLATIDTIGFNIDTQEKDSDENNVKRKLDNQLVLSSGILYINKPDNKSAQKTYPQYPIFSSTKGATVYFDKPGILGGSYDRSVYFEIPPFEIDSASSSDPKTIGFPGIFVSGGILPEFEAQLKVMPDQSLGFDHAIPADGYALYGGSGKLYNDLKLDNNGLTANGMIDYLTSTFYADNFTFYQDSATTVGTEMVMDEGEIGNASFPQASLKGYEMTWLPAQDSMYVNNTKDLFQFYNNTASLDGQAILTSKGLFGSGHLLTRGSEAQSDMLSFRQNDFGARHAAFQINTDNPKKPALAGKDIRLNFNLIQNEADISPEVEGVAALDFPYAQVRTSITKATWDLEDKKVTMTKPEDVDISNSYFYTTRKELDSLVFNASGAVYDINQLELNVTGIPYIKVADAKITPQNNEVLILQNAELQKLTNATLVIDTLNEYHRLIDGNIKINSRKSFEGDATYQYVNTVSDTFAIKFGTFKLVEAMDKEGTTYTVSSGKVEESDQFLVTPGIFYKGKVTMYANKEALELDGSVKLDLKNIPDYNTWIAYKSTGDQTEVAFDFDNSITEDGEPLNAGLHLESGTNSLYGTFLNERRTMGDIDFFTPSGVLSYNAESNEYEIESPEKKAGTSFAGSVYAYNENTSDIRFEGPFNFISNEGTFNLKAAGKGMGNLKTNEYTFNAFLAFQYDVPPQATEIMAADIKDVVDRVGAPSAHDDRTSLLYKAAEIIGDRAAKEYEKLALADYTPLVNSSTELIRNMVVSDVDLEWSEEEKAWYSTSKLALSNILATDINAKLDGFMEIKKTELGDIVNIFIQASPATWYYMGYENNRLVLASSSDDYNNEIRSRSNAAKAKLGEFVFIDGDVSEALTFVNRFRKTYFNIDGPYELNMPSEIFDEEEEFNTIIDTEDTDEESGGF